MTGLFPRPRADVPAALTSAAQARRAVVSSNLAHELTFLPVIRSACRRASIITTIRDAEDGRKVGD